jgi:branched-subunit amino acid aminotransferase/4-amino-4-deoxychorismate lyase
VDDALMLDIEGYVSETNATNVFLVREGALFTPFADHCLPGVTRATVLELARKNGIEAHERRLSLVEFYGADEVFTTGTMGELSPVLEIDRRTIGGGVGPLTRRLQELYRALTESEGSSLPF